MWASLRGLAQVLQLEQLCLANQYISRVNRNETIRELCTSSFNGVLVVLFLAYDDRRLN